MKKLLGFLLTLLCVLSPLAFVVPTAADEPLLGAGYSDEEEYPDWWPEDRSGRTFERFHNTNAPHVVDEAGIFDPQLEKELEARISKLVAETNIDLVIYTNKNSYNMSYQNMAEGYYVFNGYGRDSQYSGMILYICMDPNNRGYWIAATGNREALFTSAVNNRYYNELTDSFASNAMTGDWSTSMNTFMELTESFYKTDELPEQPKNYGLAAVIAAIVGSITGGISSGSKTATMRQPSASTSAANYKVPGSLDIRSSNNTFLYRERSVRHIPRNDNSGGGGPSYSGSHDSYGGSSFSGGGGHF